LLGLGLSNPSYKLDVVGTARINNGSSSGSLVVSGGVSGGAGADVTILGSGGANSTATLTISTYPYDSTSNPATCRFLTTDDGGFSSHLDIMTKTPGAVANALASRIRVSSAGNVGIGLTNPSYKLHVSGQIYATGDIVAFSDTRFKQALETISEPLNKVQQLTGYTYNMNTTDESTTKVSKRYTGLLAQDLEKVLPEAVHKDLDGKMSVAYGNLAGLFVESIKEIIQDRDKLKKELADITLRLERIESMIA
jgi:hypothetical protein